MNFWNRNLNLPAVLFGTVATIALIQPLTIANNSKDNLTADWYRYQAHDNSYLVNFPQKPQEKKEYIDTEAGKIYVVEAIFYDNSNYYSALHMIFPFEPQKINAEEILDVLRDSFAKSINMSIVREKNKTIGGFPAREVEMKGSNGSIVTNLIFDANGPTFYQVYVGSAEQTTNTPQASAFLNSFEIQTKK